MHDKRWEKIFRERRGEYTRASAEKIENKSLTLPLSPSSRCIINNFDDDVHGIVNMRNRCRHSLGLDTVLFLPVSICLRTAMLRESAMRERHANEENLLKYFLARCLYTYFAVY